jgi:hypothetical protein
MKIYKYDVLIQAPKLGKQIDDNVHVAVTEAVENELKPLNCKWVLIILSTKFDLMEKIWNFLSNSALLLGCFIRIPRTRYKCNRPFLGGKNMENFNVKNFLRDVVQQNSQTLYSWFLPDAKIFWHNSNEQFSVEEYIRANCEYPGD